MKVFSIILLEQSDSSSADNFIDGAMTSSSNKDSCFLLMLMDESTTSILGSANDVLVEKFATIKFTLSILGSTPISYYILRSV